MLSLITQVCGQGSFSLGSSSDYCALRNSQSVWFVVGLIILIIIIHLCTTQNQIFKEVKIRKFKNWHVYMRKQGWAMVFNFRVYECKACAEVSSDWRRRGVLRKDYCSAAAGQEIYGLSPDLHFTDSSDLQSHNSQKLLFKNS